MNKYQIIYADPPWEMLAGVYSPSYSAMDVSGIAALPVGELSDNNCALFLWVLNSKLGDGLKVIKSWGFNFKTVAFCWVKTSQKTGMPNCRVGFYTLGGMELCLLGVKGKMKPCDHRIRQVVMLPRIGHSVKPPEFRNDMVYLFGDLPRIELFARRKVEGWDCWGNEVESDIEL